MLRRINSNPLVWVSYGGFGGFMLVVADFVPTESKLEAAGVVAALFLVLITLCIVPVLCKDNRLQWEEGNRVIGNIQSTFLSREIVDQRLQQLADEFIALCQKQVQFQDAESAVAEAKAIEREIAWAKSNFWSAHALAKELGYVLKGHVSDYASTPKTPARRRGKQVA